MRPRFLGADVFAQTDIDRDLCEFDGTANKSRLGANAILAVSMAIADAAAAAKHIPLFEYLGDGLGNVLPLPQIQLFGGGAHSAWRTDVQDFLIIPSRRLELPPCSGDDAQCVPRRRGVDAQAKQVLRCG